MLSYGRPINLTSCLLNNCVEQIGKGHTQVRATTTGNRFVHADFGNLIQFTLITQIKTICIMLFI